MERLHSFLQAVAEVSVFVIGVSVLLLIALFVLDGAMGKLFRMWGIWWAFVHFIHDRPAREQAVRKWGTDEEARKKHEEQE